MSILQLKRGMKTGIVAAFRRDDDEERNDELTPDSGLFEEMSKSEVKKKPWLSTTIVIVMFCLCSCWIQRLEGACEPRKGCSTALVHYTVQADEYLDLLISRFQTTMEEVKFYNVVNDSNVNNTGQTLLFPFPCGCVNDQLSHSFTYKVQVGDTFEDIANNEFGGLSQADWIAQASGRALSDNIHRGDNLQVPVRCFCGNPRVDLFLGLFTTYLSVSTDNFSSLAFKFSTSTTLLRLFNPSVDGSGTLTAGQVLFIPSKNGPNGQYPPFQSSYDYGPTSSSSDRVLIVSASVLGGIVLSLFILVLWLSYVLLSRRKQPKKLNHDGLGVLESGLVPWSTGLSGTRSRLLKFLGRSGMLKFAGESHIQDEPLHSGPLAPNRPVGRSQLSEFLVDKSVEFSFQELANATHNFSDANKIGEGGYGAVYSATLRGQKTAVKRMNLQATREFVSELQILTHVHHTHLVQLIGYCTVESLFLIYEFVENGPLERHLHSHGLPLLSWPARVQIALDAARGLEYIHEHTKPTFIHRDVKSSNILLDSELRAKVADFGLTKLTEPGFSSGSISMSRAMRLVGTFGYMSPEYAKYGDVSPKGDVYAFGVVLFEIISAKSAIVKTIGYSGDPTIPDKEDQRSLVGMFEEVLQDPNGEEALWGLVDPALESNYPLDSAWKMARLAADCTQENTELRPDMRSVVVALMTLSPTTQNWESSSFGSDMVIPGLMSGR